jgi:signal transduction histidine kinase
VVDVAVSEVALWRAVAAFRLLALAYAAVVLALTAHEYAHPVGAWLVMAAMAAWTVVAVLAYERPARRTTPLLVLDLAVAAGAVLATRLVDDAGRAATDTLTLPTFWAAAPVLAWALARGAWRAAGAAALIGIADVVERGRVALPTVHNAVLLLVAGVIVGYGAALVRRGERAYASALRVEAASRERERLARDIHDSVLQVLALVARRGAEAGGEAAEIGRLAGEQEAALRALVARGRTAAASSGETVDVRELLSARAGSAVTVSTPATPVLLTHAVAQELVAAVGAALDNVRRHAPGAQAWVLLEEADDAVVVSVRDDGPGFEPGRLEEAATQGRLGVARSLRGRVADLGGSVDILSTPGAGTEVELRLPRRVPR